MVFRSAAFEGQGHDLTAADAQGEPGLFRSQLEQGEQLDFEDTTFYKRVLPWPTRRPADRCRVPYALSLSEP
ncbi:hypothetical protein VRB14_09040 [Pseudomonas trivialis]